jgi:uncharacterized YigZ family protein
MPVHYSVRSKVEYEQKIRRSTFLVTLAPVNNIAAAKEFITAISNHYPTASHNCWAYIVGMQGEIFHASDAGEPSGTAGKPILNALQSNNLSNIAAVVTRYFGGVKLGVRGLIEAYSSTVEKAIAESELIKLVEIIDYRLQTTYDFLEILKYNLQKLEAEISSMEYTETVKLTVKVEKQNNEAVESYIHELEANGKISRLEL